MTNIVYDRLNSSIIFNRLEDIKAIVAWNDITIQVVMCMYKYSIAESIRIETYRVTKGTSWR